MYLIPHPGMCCGIACIYGFDFMTAQTMPEINQQTLTIYRVAYPTFIFSNPSPAETALKRFRRFIKCREDVRQSGIIEVVLTTQQLINWKDELANLHFKESCRNKNSNSNNTIVIFHRLSGAEGVEKITEI